MSIPTTVRRDYVASSRRGQAHHYVSLYAGLSYSEIVSVLEPSTFTSFQNGVMSDETLGKLAGFQTFTSEQAKRLIETDADGHLMANDSGSITPHSVNEEEEKRIIQAVSVEHLLTPTRTSLTLMCVFWCVAQHKRRVLTRAQELHHLKSSVEWQLAQRDEPGTKRFLTLFRAADPENRGYLNHRQFRMLLGEKGLGLRINSRQENLLIEECSDGRGAIEARNFCSFLAVRAANAACPHCAHSSHRLRCAWLVNVCTTRAEKL